MRCNLLSRRLDLFHVAEHEDAGHDADCDEHCPDGPEIWTRGHRMLLEALSQNVCDIT